MFLLRLCSCYDYVLHMRQCMHTHTWYMHIYTQLHAHMCTHTNTHTHTHTLSLSLSPVVHVYYDIEHVHYNFVLQAKSFSHNRLTFEVHHFLSDAGESDQEVSGPGEQSCLSVDCSLLPPHAAAVNWTGGWSQVTLLITAVNLHRDYTWRAGRDLSEWQSLTKCLSSRWYVVPWMLGLTTITTITIYFIRPSRNIFQ